MLPALAAFHPMAVSKHDQQPESWHFDKRTVALMRCEVANHSQCKGYGLLSKNGTKDIVQCLLNSDVF